MLPYLLMFSNFMARKEINGSTLLRVVDERLQDQAWMAQFDKVFGLQEAIRNEEDKLNAVASA